MSSIAEFRLISVEKLNELRKLAIPQESFFGRSEDDFLQFLYENSTNLKEYPWSGYVYATLLAYLEEKDINIETTEFSELSEYITEVRGSTYIIFTSETKEKFIELLNPINFNEVEFGSYYNDFHETNENEAGKVMIDAISVLYDNLKMIDENMVIIFSL